MSILDARLSPFRGPLAYVVWGVAVGVAYTAVGELWPSAPWPVRVSLGISASASTVVAVLVGVARHRPVPAWPWLLIAAGRAPYALGDYLSLSRALSGDPLPIPSIADACYVGGYLLFAAGLVGLARGTGRRRDPAALVDALIVGVTFGLAAWLVQRQVHGGMAEAQNLVAFLYPVMDVATLSIAVRLTFRGGASSPAGRLLNLSILLLLITDSAVSELLLRGSYTIGGLFDLAWLATYLALGAAALHPTMAAIGDRPTGEPLRAHPGRIAVLGTATLVGPVSGVFVDGARIEIAVCSAIVSVLVVIRLALLLRAQLAAERDRAALLREVLQAGEHERTLLAAELHDGPIQRLAGLGLLLDSADIALDGTGAVRPQQQVASARDGVLGEIKDLRRLMAGLRPPALDHGGLEGALADVCHDFAARYEIAVDLDLDLAGIRPDNDVATALYRVAQEAMTNVRKHSKAERVRLHLRSDGDTVEMLVADEGLGFDVRSAGKGRNHFGVAAMRERAERVGGECTITSGPRGTTVRVNAPVTGTTRRSTA